MVLYSNYFSPSLNGVPSSPLYPTNGWGLKDWRHFVLIHLSERWLVLKCLSLVKFISFYSSCNSAVFSERISLVALQDVSPVLVNFHQSSFPARTSVWTMFNLKAVLMDHLLLTNIIQLHNPARTWVHLRHTFPSRLTHILKYLICSGLFCPLKCPVAVILLNWML